MRSIFTVSVSEALDWLCIHCVFSICCRCIDVDCIQSSITVPPGLLWRRTSKGHCILFHCHLAWMETSGSYTAGRIPTSEEVLWTWQQFLINLFVWICFFLTWSLSQMYRSTMTDDQCVACLRLATSSFCPDYEKPTASSSASRYLFPLIQLRTKFLFSPGLFSVCVPIECVHRLQYKVIILVSIAGLLY